MRLESQAGGPRSTTENSEIDEDGESRHVDRAKAPPLLRDRQAAAARLPSPRKSRHVAAAGRKLDDE
jgi:hypothetical protein